MGAVRIDWRACVGAWLLALFVACLPARADYLAEPGEAARAIDKVVDGLSPAPQAHTIRITDREITLVLRDAARAGDMNEWRVRTASRLFFAFESVRGPTPVAAPGMVADLASGLFALDAVALDRVDTVAAKAVAYAKLEDGGAVKSIEIARRVHLLPSPSYGDIRWSIYVASPRESATVYADAGGEIVGGDLSNTNRARNMHLIDDEDWPKEAALESLLGAAGSGRVVRDLTVDSRSVQVKADHPTQKEQTVSYTWTVSGVTRSASAWPLFPGTDPEQVFSLSEVDLSSLSAIREAAKTAWGNDRSTINYMMLRRFTDGPGKPELRWTVRFTDFATGGEVAFISNSGSVDLTATGEVRAVDLPPSRRKSRDWLDPATTLKVFGMLREQFGETARFAEIIVDRESMQILAEVPDAPGTMRNYHVTERGISASGMMMPWEAEFRPERLYTLDDIAFFSADKLGELTARTFTRLHVGPEMARSRYTFSIGQLMTPTGDFMVPSPDGKVTLEIRIESPDGWKGGRITYSSAGEEIDIVMP
ncbi:hypothetical protein [Shinella pollutisoli]|uniref:Uncharacterized protein n=1 Tax=Shinella pollutisoli TaxID=2250594 RepID=A0ABV7DC61_9HYPH|nr:hypothetical protein [Shinella pollutisoli]